MNCKDLIDLATAASEGHPGALETVKRIARDMGFEGRRGGWIYAPDGHTVMCQGWRAFAGQIVKGHHRAHVERYLVACGVAEAQTAALADKVEPEPTRPAPEWWTPKEHEVASAAITLARLMESAAAAHRVVRTTMIPTNHVAPLRSLPSGDAGGIGRLLCGRIMGGPIEALDLDRVDCLGCLDAYVSALAGRVPDPHRSADPPAEVRSPLIKP
jgi:hypothetical protein